MSYGSAAVVPRRVSSPAEAREVVEAEGAALVSGIASEEAAMDFGREMLGDELVRVGRQIEATRANAEAEGAVVEQQPADERGRKREVSRDTSLPMPPHNDGFAFGDEAPDRLFLLQARPAADGGENFLVDGLALVDLLPAEIAEFVRTVPIDHSEPGIPQGVTSPILRTTPAGRPQVRHHPFLAPVLGHDEQWPFVQAWLDAVVAARDTGARFRMDAGEMAVVDNYRMFHGRHGYADPNRLLYSIWGWTTSAVAVPDRVLDIVNAGRPAG
ncbi:TauD/TfdA family dioxygenase [Pseudonocardia pini]|uniref:TauD/TfdA family dioxygenase n=1 Tax=Pseudonocardia pini TaxID=2758030 RepID=UPI0015F0F34C|nr:TauD/TfdA family dioxygenase [Pseudonocardia pini]